MRLLFVLGALCSVGAVAACASRRPLTWDESAPTVTPSKSSSSRAASSDANSWPASASTTAGRTAGAAPAASSGLLIDRALIDLNAARARAQSQGKLSPLWSESWTLALRRIDDAVTQPPLAHDLGAFVRCRVILEVELQRDLERGVVLPARLPGQVSKTLLSVDESVQELRAANAPGTTLSPTPRMEEGDLILRAPVSPLIVSSPFGRRNDPFTQVARYHAGVDLDAPTGATVYAAASGIVVYAGPQGGYGRYVVVDHGDGVRTHYAHLSQIRVAVGALVLEGDAVGFVGSTGRSTGPHLHFAVTNALGVFLDPLAVLDIPFTAIAEQVAAKP